MNAETIADCMKLSFADTPFPAVVRQLVGAGVHAYTADLIALRNTYYGADRESVDEPLPLDPSPPIAGAFDATRRGGGRARCPARRDRLCRVPARDHAGRLRQLPRLHRRPQGDLFRPRRRFPHRAFPAGAGKLTRLTPASGGAARTIAPGRARIQRSTVALTAVMSASTSACASPVFGTVERRLADQAEMRAVRCARRAPARRRSRSAARAAPAPARSSRRGRRTARRCRHSSSGRPACRDARPLRAPRTGAPRAERPSG